MSNPFLVSHYLFDFDGTLVDSMPYWARTMLSVLERRGIPYGEDFISIITPLGLNATVDYFINYGVKSTPEALKAEIRGMLGPLYEKEIPLKEGVEDCLLAMKNQGCRLNVLTASPHSWLDPCLKRCGVWDLFDHVWSCEDFPTVKTDPAIYVLAAERLGLGVNKISFLDDNINADQAAMKAGMQVIGVYDDSSRQDQPALQALADGYIRNFGELKAQVVPERKA